MLKITTIALYAALAVSAFAQNTKKPPKMVKDSPTVYVDTVAKVYYKKSCKGMGGLQPMKLSDVKGNGYKAGVCSK